ncbi:hypothetical protein ACQX0N_09365 [Clostridium tepidum]
MKTIQIIRSMTDANTLLEKGHKIIKIDRDKRDRRYLIFLFENSINLQKDLKAITY